MQMKLAPSPSPLVGRFFAASARNATLASYLPGAARVSLLAITACKPQP
jgi:hypothetical protein